MAQGKLTHFNDNGRPVMVDISEKEASSRRAVARGCIFFSPDAYETIRKNGVEKGDVLTIAEIAGIGGAKKTADLIPLCHPLPLSSVEVKAVFNDTDCSVDVEATVKTTGRTGVEMEALTAVSVACLTVYDMTKAVDKSMLIGPIELVEKSGGKSGDFKR